MRALDSNLQDLSSAAPSCASPCILLRVHFERKLNKLHDANAWVESGCCNTQCNLSAGSHWFFQRRGTGRRMVPELVNWLVEWDTMWNAHVAFLGGARKIQIKEELPKVRWRQSGLLFVSSPLVEMEIKQGGCGEVRWQELLLTIRLQRLSPCV